MQFAGLPGALNKYKPDVLLSGLSEMQFSTSAELTYTVESTHHALCIHGLQGAKAKRTSRCIVGEEECSAWWVATESSVEFCTLLPYFGMRCSQVPTSL